MYRKTFKQKFISLNEINLKYYNEKNDVLYYKNRL